MRVDVGRTRDGSEEIALAYDDAGTCHGVILTPVDAAERERRYRAVRAACIARFGPFLGAVFYLALRARESERE